MKTQEWSLDRRNAGAPPLSPHSAPCGAGPSPAPEAKACARRASKACWGVLTSVLHHPPSTARLGAELSWDRRSLTEESPPRARRPAQRPGECARKGPTSPQLESSTLALNTNFLKGPLRTLLPGRLHKLFSKASLSPRPRSSGGFLVTPTAFHRGGNLDVRHLGPARASFFAQRSNQKKKKK